MAVDLSALTDYSFTQIKLAAKAAMVNAAVGGGRLVINGRDITRISITEAQNLYRWASEMEASESGGPDGTGVVLLSFPQE